MRAWRLTAAQRRKLERELTRTRDADLFRRILALLEVDAGCPLGEVAQRLRVEIRSGKCQTIREPFQQDL